VARAGELRQVERTFAVEHGQLLLRRRGLGKDIRVTRGQAGLVERFTHHVQRIEPVALHPGLMLDGCRDAAHARQRQGRHCQQAREDEAKTK
jgi:hypothetical protein